MKAKIIMNILDKESKSNKWKVEEPTDTILSEAQLALIEVAIDEQAKRLKYHIRTDGWPVATDMYVNDVLREIFGCNFDDYVTARMANETKEVYVKYDGKSRFVNTVEKVFYAPVTDALYTGLVKLDVNTDIILGEL